MLANPDKPINWIRLSPNQSIDVLVRASIQQCDFNPIQRQQPSNITRQVGRSRATLCAKFLCVLPLAGAISRNIELRYQTQMMQHYIRMVPQSIRGSCQPQAVGKIAQILGPRTIAKHKIIKHLSRSHVQMRRPQPRSISVLCGRDVNVHVDHRIAELAPKVFLENFEVSGRRGQQ